MDVTGACGFMLTNYCSETAELLEEDKDIVMFKMPEELMEKTAYCLSHDIERKKIARAGHGKMVNYYTHKRKFEEIMERVRRDE